ncbi:MAG: serine hydrolase [Clostridia bacterium]|nr:serine hydrolase [Clostridia bacterium]
MKTSTKLSSKRIYEFYKELEKCGIENHGLLIMKDGEILFEEYAYPYSADMPHTLFSVTKSVVATAAGFAIDEGLFSLDSQVLQFFPEYEHCESDEWSNLTVRSVLTMQSNKEFSFLQDMTGNYAQMFMKAPFRKDKGFLYSNNDAHMVAAIIQKLSGENLVDYLAPRLFEPLGIEKPFWETNSIGECIGGTGAHMTLRDLAKICQCYADGGKYNGAQVIPEWWTKEATKRQVVLEGRDDEDGYGYLFWLHNGIFSMNGMFGQQISCFPQHNAIVASFNSIVNDTMNNKLIKSLVPAVFEEETSEEWDKKLGEYLENRAEKPIACTDLPAIPTGKTFYITPACDVLAKAMFPSSIIPRSLTSSFAKRTKKNFDKVSFELDENVLTVKWYEEEDEVVIKCGLDGAPRMSNCSIKGYRYDIWAYAYSESGNLKAVVKPLNTLATQRMVFEFSENWVKIQIKGTPSFTEFICKNANESSFVKNSGKLRPFIMKCVKAVLATTERPIKFKAK